MSAAQKYYKFPRTYHFLWSENLQNDDRLLQSLEGLIGKEVVVSLKIDGENCNFYPDHIHARSPDSKDHLSRHWVKALHASIKHQIPNGFRICGENTYALHSIFYSQLTSYFYVYAIFDENNVCLSYQDTKDFAELLGLEMVPLLYKGVFNEEEIKRCYTGKSAFKGWTPKPEIIDFNEFRKRIYDGEELSSFADETQEGYVCRVGHSFLYNDYNKYVAKFVRKSHVSSSNNWMYEAVISNLLKKEKYVDTKEDRDTV